MKRREEKRREKRREERREKKKRRERERKTLKEPPLFPSRLPLDACRLRRRTREEGPVSVFVFLISIFYLSLCVRCVCDMNSVSLGESSVKERVRELSELAGLDLNEEVFEVIVELVQLDVVPTAIAQVLKSLCNKAAKNTSANRQQINA